MILFYIVYSQPGNLVIETLEPTLRWPLCLRPEVEVVRNIVLRCHTSHPESQEMFPCPILSLL